MGNHVLKAFFYIDAVKADKIRRKSYEKTIVIGNSIIVFVATMAPTVAFAAVAELEREYILQRQREGIAIAKTKGKYTGRKPRPLPDNFERVVARVPGKSPPQKPCGRPGLNLTPGDMNLDPYIFRRAERCVLY